MQKKLSRKLVRNERMTNVDRGAELLPFTKQKYTILQNNRGRGERTSYEREETSGDCGVTSLFKFEGVDLREESHQN